MQKKCKVLTALLLVITLGFTSVCTTWAAETYDNESVTIGTTEEELGKEGMANSDEAEINNASRDNENNDSTQNLGKESDNSNEVPDNKNEIVTEENSDDVDAEEEEGVDDESIVEESSAESYTANETAEIEEPSEEETSIEAKAASVFAGGSGTESDPYKVSTAAQLNSIRNYPEAYFIQTTDINMSSISNWEPIGKDSDHCFWGGYDGKGHTISNLKIKNDGSETYIGLFGYAGPWIKNLNLENVNIVIDLSLSNGPIQVGTLAGDAFVVNCSASGTITVTGSDRYGCDIGGIAGRAQGIENSHSDVTITVNCNGSVDMNIGGLAGECLHGTAVNSYFKGAITTSGNCAYVGGIVGTIAWGSGVTNCVNYGDISVNNESAGSTVAGIVGTIYADDNTEFVENCVNFGNITGSDVAFVVGITRADGITVHNCFNLGNIKGNSYSGRIYTAEERNVNAYGNFGYENATVNGSIPTGGLLPSGFNGSDMSTENLRFVISDILEDCGCEWVNPTGENTEIDSNTIIYYKDGRNSVKLDYGLDDCITGSSTSYDPKLAYLLIALATSAYQGEQPFTLLDKRGGGFRSGGFPDDPLAITESLRNLGFSAENIIEENYYTDAYDPDYNEDSTAFTLATKVLSNGERVVTIVVRGSYGGFGQDGKFHVNWTKWASDWRGNTNFKNYNKGLHEGFSEAADEIINRLDKFLTEKAIGKDDTKYVITGHSRGAAVANLVSKKLIDSGVSKNKVYDYNFACPDSGRDYDREWNRNNKYGSMFNINNVKDIVGVIPGNVFNASLNLNTAITEVFSLDHEFGILFWGKYGTTYFFSKNWGTVGDNAIGDPNVEHQPTYYLNYLKKPSESQFKSWTEARAVLAANGVKEGFKKFGRLIGIFCPVDTVIKDGSGNLVAEIINGEQKYYNNSFGHIVIITADDQSLIYLSGDNDYIISMKGTDNGTLSYMATDIVSASDDGNVITYENISLEKGKEIISYIDSKETAENTPLFVVDDNGNLIKEINIDGTEEGVLNSGACGDNLKWIIVGTSSDPTLIISGTGEMYNYPAYSKIPWVMYSTKINRIFVSNGVTSISDYAFYNSFNVSKISLPDTVRSIGYLSFGGCVKLKNFYISSNLTTIADGAFNSGTSANTTRIESYILSRDNPMFSLVDGALYSKDKKTLLSCPAGREGGFVISDGVQTIASNAFARCTKVSSIIIPDSVKYIKKYAFYNAGITEITIPATVKELEENTISACPYLQTATINAPLEILKKHVFSGDRELQSVNLPGTLKIIEQFAFFTCPSLKDIYFAGSENLWAQIRIDRVQSNDNDLDHVTVHCIKEIIPTVNLSRKTFVYNGKIQKPVVTVKDGNTVLTTSDYNITWPSDCKNAGIYKLSVKLIGNYAGSADVSYTIKKAANKITAKNIVKTYSAKTQSLTLGAKITYGTPKYTSSSKSVTVSKAGKVTVKAKFIGKATITITAPEKANYSKQTKKITITVNPTKTALSSVTSPSAGKMTVKWKKNAVSTGYLFQYSTSSKFVKPKTVWITKNSTLTKTIGSLAKGKKYYVRIRTYKTVGKTKFYSGWSAAKTVTIKK